jgi:acetyltransferase
MLASASPETYASCLKILLEDDNVDGVMVILPPPPMFTAQAVAKEVTGIIKQFAKPVVIALLGSLLIEEARSTFQDSKIPTYPFPERAAAALSALVKRAEFLDDGALTIDQLKPSFDRAPQTNVEDLLAAYGIPTARLKLACSLEETRAIADEIGYPVVMKIASAEILHKSDVGGVALDIKDASSLQSAYTQMMKSVKAAKPEAVIDGVLIQRQIPDGQEIIVGAVRDPQFGPLMMFGSGGVEVEGLKDVTFALAPLGQVQAQKMLGKTWAGRKLKGFRNILPADEAAVIDVLIGLSYLILENPAITEIEINPLRVLHKGAIAVDVRVK